MIIATTVSACISITSVILFVVVYRQRRKATAAASAQDPLQPPLYTEIDHSFRSEVPGTPPPRYKSEPDIAARLMAVETNRDNLQRQYRPLEEGI